VEKVLMDEKRHSERSEESGVHRGPGKILRCAQNDNSAAAL
jgi:hypothetical protein